MEGEGENKWVSCMFYPGTSHPLPMSLNVQYLEGIKKKSVLLFSDMEQPHCVTVTTAKTENLSISHESKEL